MVWPPFCPLQLAQLYLPYYPKAGLSNSNKPLSLKDPAGPLVRAVGWQQTERMHKFLANPAMAAARNVWEQHQEYTPQYKCGAKAAIASSR